MSEIQMAAAMHGVMPRAVESVRTANTRTLQLSALRTYDCALDAAHAHKLGGNFPDELAIVLSHLGAMGRVDYAIKPKSFMSDCREVDFSPADRTSGCAAPDFDDILNRIERAIGVRSRHLAF